MVFPTLRQRGHDEDCDVATPWALPFPGLDWRPFPEVGDWLEPFLPGELWGEL